MAHAVAVAASDHVNSDILARIGEMVEKLKTKHFSFHGVIPAERAAHARALVGNIHLYGDRKNFVVRKRHPVWMLAQGKTVCENSVVIEQIKEDVSTVTVKAAEERHED